MLVWSTSRITPSAADLVYKVGYIATCQSCLDLASTLGKTQCHDVRAFSFWQPFATDGGLCSLVTGRNTGLSFVWCSWECC